MNRHQTVDILSDPYKNAMQVVIGKEEKRSQDGYSETHRFRKHWNVWLKCSFPLLCVGNGAEDWITAAESAVPTHWSPGPLIRLRKDGVLICCPGFWLLGSRNPPTFVISVAGTIDSKSFLSYISVGPASQGTVTDWVFVSTITCLGKNSKKVLS